MMGTFRLREPPEEPCEKMFLPSIGYQRLPQVTTGVRGVTVGGAEGPGHTVPESFKTGINCSLPVLNRSWPLSAAGVAPGPFRPRVKAGRAGGLVWSARHPFSIRCAGMNGCEKPNDPAGWQSD